MGRLLPGTPGFRSGRIGVFSVDRPTLRIIENVLPGDGQFTLVSQCTFVVLPLPNGSARGSAKAINVYFGA